MKKRYLSLLNVLACMMVVCIHTASSFFDYDNTFSWGFANVIHQVTYAGVPLFIMICGENLIDYRERYSTKVFLKKRIMKTLIPLIAWNIIAFVLMVIFRVDSRPEILGIKDALNAFFDSKIVSIYWFFFSLFGVYLSIPVLSAIEKSRRKEVFSYTVIVWLLFNIIIPLVSGKLAINWNSSLRIETCGGYVILAIIGYLIGHYDINKKYRIIIYVISLCSLLVRIIVPYYLSISSGELQNVIYGYTELSCVLYSIGIFIFIKYLKISEKFNGLLDKIASLSDYTFGVYLMHYLLIDFVLKVFKLNTKNVIYMLIAPWMYISVCMVATWIIKKIPVVKRIVP